MIRTYHSLKTERHHWFALRAGVKRFEIRRDDRGFQRGDVLLLRLLTEAPGGGYEDEEGWTTSLPECAKTISATVDWILTGGQYGIEPGYVIMSITVIYKGHDDSY